MKQLFERFTVWHTAFKIKAAFNRLQAIADDDYFSYNHEMTQCEIIMAMKRLSNAHEWLTGKTLL